MERKDYWEKFSKADEVEREELSKAEEARARASAEKLNADDFEVFLNRK
jgi:hypothetical protein